MGRRNIKNISFIIISVFLFTISLVGCTEKEDETVQHVELENEQKEELILAIGGEPDDGFDPITGWGRYGSPLFQSTLLKRDASFNVVPDVATSYKVSDDQLVWTVQLREDVLFSDGEPLTAEDVAFTFKQAAESASIVDLQVLEDVQAVDTYTVQFTLKEPRSTFIQHLVSTGIVPKHAYDDTYNENPIGSGPYIFVQWDKGQQLIVEQNPHYYGEQSDFIKLTFLFLSEDANFAAAKAGEVDVASIPAAFGNQQIDGMTLIEHESVDNRGISFPVVQDEGNVTEDGIPIGNDVTADVAIRKAINYAIDRQALVDGVLEGFGTPAYSVSDQLPWWNENTAIEDGNIDKAQEILAEAGWEMGSDGMLEKDGLRAEMMLYYPSNDQVRQSLSIAIADMMKEIGIIIQVEGKSWDELEAVKYAHPTLMGWGSYDPFEMYSLYSSKTAGIDWFNLSFYANDVVDSYLEQALRAANAEEANEYWKKAQWDGTTGFSALGDAPWAWLVNLSHLYFVKDGLHLGEQKIEPHAHGWPITDNISEWYWEK